MILVDSHCHLDMLVGYDSHDNIIKRAIESNVHYMQTICTRLEDFPKILVIAENYRNVFASIGIHPSEVREVISASELINLAKNDRVVGLGETGLDYHYNNSPRQDQRNSFCQHLQVSTELDLPIIIHTREADEDTLACLDDYPTAKGVFHCFSGSADLAKAALDRGFYLSFSGIITFKNAEELRQVVQFAPLDRILVETDSPFLAPIPHRGKRNEPAFTRINAEKIAEVKGLSFEDVAKETTESFFALFDKCT